MDKQFGDGGCLCGAVRFGVTGEPKRVGICHCLDCRKAHGAAFNSYAIFDAAQVELRGATTAYVRPGGGVGSSRVDLQACKLEYSIVSPK